MFKEMVSQYLTTKISSSNIYDTDSRQDELQ